MAAVLSAVQPQATSTLTQPAAPLNMRGLEALGATLSARFTQYEGDRRLAELKWARNARQFLGIYDPEIDAAIDKNRSRAYPKLTRVKCVSMLSRLMNLLFPASDKNWTMEPGKVPNLSAEDLQPILDTLMPPNGQAPDDEAIEKAIRDFARKRCDRLELEIEDQLQELGGNRGNDYVALCRKVLASGIQYGAGVLRGPFVEEQQQRFWQVANGKLVANTRTAFRPRFEFVPIWDYYPDMGAKTLASMDGRFLRPVMSKHQLIALKNRSDFFADQIDRVLALHPTGNYRRRNFETELRAMGVQMNSSVAETGKYEAVMWDGFVSGQDLANIGLDVGQDKLTQDVHAQVWMVGSIIIKAEVDPWSKLLQGAEMPQWHHFIFEEDESFLLGNGLPNIMRDSQLGLCAATRMMIDNASVQRVFEVNYSLLRSDADITTINPDMLIPRDDDNPAATANLPAVRPVELPLALDKLKLMADMFQGFADTETFVGAATGGDMQKGPSEPFRTAAGASMLRGDAALPFKDVVRNFDAFTESVIGSIILFNNQFGDPKLKGDYQPVARGATSLVAKEVQGMQLDEMSRTLTDEEKRYLNPRGLLRLRMKVRDMDHDDIVYDDARCDQIDEQISQQQQADAAMATRTAEANVRKILSDALKNIAQANKNAASAEAATANVILQALEKGLNPDMLANTTPSNQGTPNGQPAGAAAAGEAAAGSDSSQQQLPGVGGLASATGDAAASPGFGAAAMPAG